MKWRYFNELLPWAMLALTVLDHSPWAWVWLSLIAIRSLARSVRAAREYEQAKQSVRVFDEDGDAS